MTGPHTWQLFAGRDGSLRLERRQAPRRRTWAIFRFATAKAAHAAMIWIRSRCDGGGGDGVVPAMGGIGDDREAFDQLCAWADSVALILADKLAPGDFTYLRSAMP